MDQKLKILQLCHKPPLPAVDGGTIAMNNITQGFLKLGHQVKVMTLFTHKHPFVPEKFPEGFAEQTGIEGVYVDTRVNLVDAFSSLVTRDSYNITRFFSTDFDRRLQEVLEEQDFDIIHVESLFMTPYLETCKRLSKAKIFLRSHNLEYMIWERMAQGEESMPKRTYLKYLAKKLKEYEIRVVNDVDGIVCISSEDLIKYQNLGCDKPLINIPFGIDFEKFHNYNEHETPADFNLFHIGSMDWSPNLEAIIWFLTEVWGEIQQRFPSLKLYLAGRNMPADLLDENYKNVEVVGEVDDAYAFMKANGIMIVPLLSAGGIRVKIIEGMALKKCVISTKIGAEGIDYTHRENIFIANTAHEMIEAINELIKNKTLAEKMGAKAQDLIREQYDNSKLIAELTEFYLKS